MTEGEQRMSKALESAHWRIKELERENAELKLDAERYRWLFKGIKVYSQFHDVYSAWDGCDGKIGFDAAIDEAMK